MPDVMLLLQLDHQRMATLLRLIERQAANLARRDPVNDRLLESAFDYVSTHPDQCHHPKEDQVYRKLVDRRPEMAESIGDLVRDHEKLGRLTRDAGVAVRNWRTLGCPPDDGLAAQLDAFVTHYRLHVLMEDVHFFPAASRSLSRQDLEEIDFALFDAPDPLIEWDAEGRFGELRAEILRMSADEELVERRRAEAKLLATIRDVATFNAVMEQSGESIRLAHGLAGGYDVRDAEALVAHVPACDESRAAWCAYFLWRGRAAQAPAGGQSVREPNPG